MGPRRRASLASNPFLIGAITTLVIVVAVYLSYNANNGLPFVATYNLKLQIPNGYGLIVGNEVRIGGTRVGQITAMYPKLNPRTGQSYALVETKLQKGAGPLPANSTDSVLSRSSVGLKYLAIFRGSGKPSVPSGGTIPLSHFKEPVELYQFFNMFNKPTRVASEENLIDGGDGFAGRGESLNHALRTFRPLVIHLEPVMRNLASPRTAFGELWKDLDKPAEQTAPVAQRNARFYVDLDTFFKAWASVPRQIEESIEEGPHSLQVSTRSFREQAAFTENSAEFMRLLRPSAHILRTAAPAFAGALEKGIESYPQAVTLNAQLKVFLEHLKSFATNPAVELGLRELTQTARLAGEVVAGIAPEQVRCNYVTLTFRNIASLLSESIGIGTLAQAVTVLAPTGPNGEGVPSSTYAHGPSPEASFDVGRQQRFNDNYIHVNPYPNAGAKGQPPICEAGNEVYQIGVPVLGHSSKVSSGREATKRSENLYGHRYPSATLRALGIKGGKE